MELVRQLAASGHRVFGLDDARKLAPLVGVSPNYLPQALHYLAQTAWVVRLRKGLYALASPVPGVAPVHEFEIAMALVRPAAISHWSALHFHGLTEQIPHVVYVLTTLGATIPRVRVRSGREDHQSRGYQVGNVFYRFVQVNKERYFATRQQWLGEVKITVTDPERTLLDGLTRPQHCGGIAEVLHAFERHQSKLNLEKIIAYALKLDAATAKRLGWVLEDLGVEPAKLERLARLPIRGYRPLDATGPRRGPCNQRWMVQVNLPA